MDNAFIIWLISNAFIILLISYVLVPSLVFLLLAERRLVSETYGNIAIFFLALLCGIVSALAVGGRIIPEVYGTIANAVAIFVTVFGVLSILELWRQRRRNEQWGSELLTRTDDIFVDKATEDQAVFEQIQNCLPNKCSDLNESSISAPDQFYVALQNRLKNCKVVVVPYYNTPISWVTKRLELYNRLRILNKVIICTNQQMIGVPTVLKTGVKIVFSEQCNCENLKIEVLRLFNN